MVVDFISNALIQRHSAGWAIPRALLKPMLNALRIRKDPQTGKEFSATIALYLGVDLLKGEIPRVKSKESTFWDFVNKEYKPALDSLQTVYARFRAENPRHAIIVDVRVADALWTAAKVVDAYFMRELRTTDRDQQRIEAINKKLYSFVFGLQRHPSHGVMDFGVLKAISLTGRCDGIEGLGRNYIAASLRRIFRVRRGVRFGDVVRVLSDLITDNFSSNLGPFLYRTCRDGIAQLARLERRSKQSKLTRAAETELAKLTGELAKTCERLIIKGNSDPCAAELAGRFFRNCDSVFPADDRAALKNVLLTNGSPGVVVECVLLAPWIFDGAMDWVELAANHIALSLLKHKTSPLLVEQNPLEKSSHGGVVPKNGVLKTVAWTVNPKIIDSVVPRLVSKIGDHGLGDFFAMRLQAERSMRLALGDGLLYATALVKALGLFRTSNYKQSKADIELVGHLVEGGSVVELAQAFYRLASFLDEQTCRQVAEIYARDSYAMVRDLLSLQDLCGENLMRRFSFDLSSCRSLEEIGRVVIELGKSENAPKSN
jgi:hypothetical protein